jgi:hypothetical protein
MGTVYRCTSYAVEAPGFIRALGTVYQLDGGAE